MKKCIVFLLSWLLALGAVVPVLATERSDNQIGFGDISTHWAKTDILAMCEGSNPLFKGTGDVDGVAMFSPDRTMTGKEFLTVIVRAMYPNEIRALTQGEDWYNPIQDVVQNHDLEYKGFNANENISRQSMAKIMAKVLEQKGEDTSKLVPTGKIADFNEVGSYFQRDVRVVYSLGIITGIDANGTFNPTGTVDRAQGATILHRLLDKTCRATVDFTDTSSTTSQGHQEFKEGEPHAFPKVGDVVIKADGTRVVLTETVVGHYTDGTGREIKVLGFQQGVDYVTGTGILTGFSVIPGDGTGFVKCESTNEVFTKDQWKMIKSFTAKDLDNLAGDYDGEVYNMYWQWSAEREEWHWIGGATH